MNFRAILAILAVTSLPALSSCSNHLAVSGYQDGWCPDGNCTSKQTSVAGRSGFNTNAASGRVVKDKCGTEPMTRVEVDRSLGQGLVSVLTLGIVNQATIKFECAKPDTSQPLVSCTTIDGTGDTNTPVQITCTKPGTGGDETVEYDCTATGTPEDPTMLVSFTCSDVTTSWFLTEPASARG
ncbi:hypothetical protein QWY75_13275 [Pontixanthobacter aestiaquae]|uniref:Ig-like domain-containing protein n=1 Tax=Pontixanthobacter aestiaquae TaxID=1509367 RepID=A0A844Z424_9SPHN|nr:hypothetical protein [Pontixanthobacter aestiaquae]MDN3647178.1 hypothetical protein [Pontixanthobacter aestiaquae]MXO81847.1 hypothetical protein [Pontixanthobacter aestiaquae]